MIWGRRGDAGGRKGVNVSRVIPVRVVINPSANPTQLQRHNPFPPPPKKPGKRKLSPRLTPLPFSFMSILPHPRFFRWGVGLGKE